MRSGVESFVSGWIVHRPTAQTASILFMPAGAPRDELLDLVDDIGDVEVARVDLERVLGRLHPHRVALVAGAQVGGERVGADVGPLGEAALSRIARSAWR